MSKVLKGYVPFTNVSRSQSELAVFGRISKEKIIELCDFFSNEIPYVPPDLSKLKKILGNGFVRDDIMELGVAFYNFVIGKRNPEKIFEIIDMSKLDADKKSVLKEVVKKIHAETDLDKVSASVASGFLKVFGYPHIHGINTVTEFRPISGDSGITKVIPSLIVSVNIHDLDIDKTVNFQLGLKEVEEFVEKLNKGVRSLKIEMQDLRDKFGEDIID